MSLASDQFLHSSLGLEDSGTRYNVGLLPTPLPGFQEAVPPAPGGSGTAEHHPAGSPAPALETAETAGEASGWGCCSGQGPGTLLATLA